jgi:hypothetical protein
MLFGLGHDASFSTQDEFNQEILFSHNVAKLAKNGMSHLASTPGTDTSLGVLCGSVWPASWPLREMPFRSDPSFVSYCLFQVTIGQRTFSNSDFGALQTGQVQSSGSFSKGVPSFASSYS